MRSGLILPGVVVLALINLVWCWPIYFAKGVPATKDLLLSYQPMHHSLCVDQESFYRVWEPRGGFGFPMLAESQASQFYPLALISRLLLDPALGLFHLVYFHLFLAGAFMFLLARELGLGFAAGLMTGTAWMGCGFLTNHVGIPPMLFQGVWTALIAACMVRFGRTGALGALGLAGLCLGWQLLAGHFQIACYSMLFVALFGWVADPSDSFKQHTRKWMTAMAVMLALGVAWSWIQLKPTFDFYLLSSRAAGAAEDWLSWHPLQLATLIQPFLFGGDSQPILVGEVPDHLKTYWGGAPGWMTVLYVGLIPFSFALVSIKGCRQRIPRFLILALTLSLVFSAGKYTPLYPFLTDIPGWGAFRFPARWLYIAHFCLALLAGYGLQYFLDDKTRIFKPLAASMVIGALVFFLALAAYGLLAPTLLPFGQSVLGSPAAARRLLTQAAETLDPLSRQNLLAVGLAVSAGLTIWWLGGSLRDRAAHWLVAVLMMLTVLDLGLYQAHQRVLVSPHFYRRLPADIDTLPTSSMDTRVFSIARYHADSYDHQLDLLPPSLNLRTPVGQVDYRGSLYFSRFKRFFNEVYGSNVDGVGRVLPDIGGIDLLSTAGVGYVLRREPARLGPGIDDLGKKDLTWRYRLRNATDNIRWVSGHQAASDPEAAWRMIRAAAFDAHREVVIEKTPLLSKRPSPADRGRVQRLTRQKDRLDCVVDSSSEGWLVVNSTWSPNWKAMVDRTPAGVVRANYLFQAVRVPQGRHQVHLFYREPALVQGLFSALAAVLATCCFIWRDSKQKRPDRLR